MEKYLVGCWKSSTATKWKEKQLFPALHSHGNTIGSYIYANNCQSSSVIGAAAK